VKTALKQHRYATERAESVTALRPVGRHAEARRLTDGREQQVELSCSLRDALAGLLAPLTLPSGVLPGPTATAFPTATAAERRLQKVRQRVYVT
jgi:hypothetical protein